MFFSTSVAGHQHAGVPSRIAARDSWKTGCSAFISPGAASPSCFHPAAIGLPQRRRGAGAHAVRPSTDAVRAQHLLAADIVAVGPVSPRRKSVVVAGRSTRAPIVACRDMRSFSRVFSVSHSRSRFTMSRRATALPAPPPQSCAEFRRRALNRSSSWIRRSHSIDGPAPFRPSSST